MIGKKDFAEVLDEMCDLEGQYDDNDNFIPDYEFTAAIRHLDLGGATYVDGEELPYFGYHTQLETLILPHGIKSTLEEDDTGFSESESLRTVIFPEGLKIIGGFHSCPKLTEVILPESLEKIESHAFGGCEAITSIRIPASVKEMDGSCFAGCNITSYEVDEGNSYYTAIDGVIYTKDLNELVAFPSNSPIKHFVVPSSTKIVGSRAFWSSNVETVELPNGLTTIGYGAFGFSNISSINIPDSVKEIEKDALEFCRGLNKIGKA